MNKSTSEQKYSISADGMNNIDIRVDRAADYTKNGDPIISVERDKLKSIKLYISVPRSELPTDSKDITFTVKDIESETADIQTTSFRGPKT